MSRYNLSLDRRARRITWAIIAAVLLATAWISYRNIEVGGYYPAWFLTFALAIAALYILSIPRSIRLTEKALEIHCIVELTTIPLTNIVSARPLRTRNTHLVPLLGSYGFFGYYGYYLNYQNWEIVRLYASQWQNLIEIEDIHDQKYVINNPDFPSITRLLTEAESRDGGERHR